MNLIKCNSDCSHQQDGYCKLDDVTVVSNTVADGCVYYQRRESAGKKDGRPSH